MKIKSFATYGVGMDIIYEDILSTGAIAVVVDKSTSTVWQYLKKRGY